MPLILKTYAELVELVKAEIRNRIPGADTSDGSDYDVSARILASVFHGNQAQAQYLSRQILPSTAEKIFLELHAEIRKLGALPAAAASGKVLLVDVASPAGSPPYVQPAGSELSHADGTTYETDAPATLDQPSWSGKTVGPGATRSRIPVNPSTSGMAAGDPISIDGVETAIKEVLTAVSSVDLYTELPTAPTSGTAINPVVGAVADITADDAGAETNKPPLDTLTLDAPADPDISPTAVVLELTGGGDDETEGELRSRILDFLSNRPGSGNREHYRSWARQTPGVRLADAFVYPGHRGLGTATVVPLGVSGARYVGAAAVAKVLEHLEANASFHDDISVLSHGITVIKTNVDVTITTGRGFEPDWVGSRTVASGSTTTRINLTSSPVGTIEVGDRVLVQVTVAGRSRLIQAEVQASVSSGGTHYIDLVDALPEAPAAGVNIRPGGPAVEDAIEAIENLFDSLGPGDTTPTTGRSTRHPSPEVAWPDVLARAAITAALMGVGGVINVPAIASPGTDVTPNALDIVQLGTLTIRHA